MEKIKVSHKILLLLASIFILISIFLPIWRIDLDAPQYPEGLRLLIFANHLGGDVEIINGLNHYIGMKTLHANEFIEFTVLPYLLGFFALLPLIVIFVNKTKYVLWLLLLFIAFGVSAIFDFWHWEYVYGHNLDPNAAIIVPGMAYQPPLIGFKQLLNFGAFSFPDLGGWSLFIGGFLILIVYILSSGIFNKFLGIKVASAILLFSFISCQTHLPEAIRLNKDNCANCKMTITDGHFATELVTKKGRVYKFDDIKCMLAFKKAEPDKVASKHFVNNYTEDNKLIPAESAFYIKGGLVVSPMAGNIAAFENKEKALQFNNKLKGVLLSWNDILNQK